MQLAEAFEHLRFVVQDWALVADIGVKFWDDAVLPFLSFAHFVAAYDFFTLQPVINASVFLLHVVLHDWSDSFVRKNSEASP